MKVSMFYTPTENVFQAIETIRSYCKNHSNGKCKRCPLRWASYNMKDQFIGYTCQLNNMPYYYNSEYLKCGLVQLNDELVSDAVATIYGFCQQDEDYHCDQCRLR